MNMFDAVPLIKAPASWPTAVAATVAMSSLAGLDLVAAYAAKEWVLTRRVVPFLIGMVATMLLFWVYASALQYAELIVVTLGWIVLLQVGILVIDALRYDVHHSPGTWTVVVVIMAAQGYLVTTSGAG